ncbi:MAG TPA: amylo-alpha-1,6-glucosidase [Steroidobacteraceae bacterium]|nr:amylo-alpha-1,6-glucosidase [Steroidobacteraceae bacterium]
MTAMEADEVLRISDRYYILATSARIDDRTRVLKHGDLFAVFDRFGDVENAGSGGPGIYGLYERDTRHLSRLRLRLADGRPLLLSSAIKDDNALLTVDLMNPDIAADGPAIPRGTVHVFRALCLWNGACHERLRVHNYSTEPITLALVLEFGADFADIFEVRGIDRERRGRCLPCELSADAVRFAYEGLDGRLRRTRIAFDPAPARLDEKQAHFELRLPPRSEQTFRFSIACESPPSGPASTTLQPAAWYEKAAADASAALAQAREEEPEIRTSNEQFNNWIDRSLADLHMMRTETPYGPYPYAGVPWFSTPFGRDGIVTALQSLWMNPALARGVLRYLAATQAEEENEEQDAQPGKILHEARGGEMAGSGEVPFGRYYGSVDATPLFVMLAGAYFRRTGDAALIRELRPAIDRALRWIDDYGDPDGDGFIEYERRSARGLVQQGWKDSQDSVFHADGTLAEGPIALCEVQGMVYAAWRAAARLAVLVGDGERAVGLAARAEQLRSRFERSFWCERIGTYALALDGRKRPCEVSTSNAGQCLYTGIASPRRAARVAATLLDTPGYSGWGIRTVAASEARYNPMSYHNGSVWPHDNSLIAAGFARYGLRAEALRVMNGMFDASHFFELHRLPELFCGFARRPGEAPVQYPVSCSPQAWAAGSALLFLQSVLNLRVNGEESQVLFSDPALPEYLQAVSIRGLRIRDASLDVVAVRQDGGTAIDVTRKEGNVEVRVTK